VKSIRSTIRFVSIILLVCVGGCRKAPLLIIAQSTTLRPGEPLTLRTPQPLQVIGSINQLVIEVVESDSVNSSPTGRYGIRRSDGVVVQLGAVLLHQDGTVDTLSRSGYMGNRIFTIGTNPRDTLQPPFVAIRIIASDSITLGLIGWSSRNID
jgi:hypothetical protein